MKSASDKYDFLSVLSNSTNDLKVESVDAVRFYRNYKPMKANAERKIFELEYAWQKGKYYVSKMKKFHYKKFFNSRRLPEREKKFLENPFYFHDNSSAFDDNGKGDYYLYGLYAGWPHVLMIDKEGYFSNENEFMKLSIERLLSHKNSLLSSASTTQIVSRIDKSMSVPAVLSLCRPKDPLIRMKMLERHAIDTTRRKDHNKEALEPFAASINFPPQFPIDFDESQPFPKSLKELALKQQRKRMMVGSDYRRAPVIGKPSVITEPAKIFSMILRDKSRSLFVDAETQTTGEFLFEDIRQKFSKDNILSMNELREWYQSFINKKRIPLHNYQYSLFFLAPRSTSKSTGFYDIQPKVESPWLSKMIKDGKFTRKYYLENFRVSPVTQTASTIKGIKAKSGKAK